MKSHRPLGGPFVLTRERKTMEFKYHAEGTRWRQGAGGFCIELTRSGLDSANKESSLSSPTKEKGRPENSRTVRDNHLQTPEPKQKRCAKQPNKQKRNQPPASPGREAGGVVVHRRCGGKAALGQQKPHDVPKITPVGKHSVIRTGFCCRVMWWCWWRWSRKTLHSGPVAWDFRDSSLYGCRWAQIKYKLRTNAELHSLQYSMNSATNICNRKDSDDGHYSSRLSPTATDKTPGVTDWQRKPECAFAELREDRVSPRASASHQR
ncbi:hypothetical protein MUG91_G167n5 [Manis pentadactyla]|nr:hypothetical protein MUG91_G167n5 [Manis pentadactyla]